MIFYTIKTKKENKQMSKFRISLKDMRNKFLEKFKEKPFENKLSRMV